MYFAIKVAIVAIVLACLCVKNDREFHNLKFSTRQVAVLDLPIIDTEWRLWVYSEEINQLSEMIRDEGIGYPAEDGCCWEPVRASLDRFVEALGLHDDGGEHWVNWSKHMSPEARRVFWRRISDYCRRGQFELASYVLESMRSTSGIYSEKDIRGALDLFEEAGRAKGLEDFGR